MLTKLKRSAGKLALAAALSLGLTSTASAIELTMYYPVAVGGALTKIVDGLVADFEKANPDINVNAIYAGNYNDARIKALAALKSGEPAQTSVMFSIDIYELIEQDAIVAFDDVVSSAEDKAWLDSFYPALMENGRTQGKTWGIPFQRSTIVMYYNKDAFRDAGLDPEAPPATWQELTAAAEKLTAADGSRSGLLSYRGTTYHGAQPFTVLKGEVTVELRVLVDRVIVEAFAQHGRAQLTAHEWGAEGNTAVHMRSAGTQPAVLSTYEIFGMGCGWL